MKKLCLLIITMLFLLPGKSGLAAAESAKSAYLLNAITGDVVFEKNADEKLPMASTTKIMTLLLAVENTEPDDMVTVPREAVLEEGSSAYIEEGARITMRDLEYGLMLNSGNDAAMAIAYHISGGKEAFAEKMNAEAKKIGVKNTSYKNPNGLDAEGHYTTAKDLAKITQYALTKPQFAEIVKTREYIATMTRKNGSVTKITYENHNRLLREIEGCIGVKTGYTKADGRCLVSAAERDGMRYIAVTLNDPDDWADHKELLEIGFSNCKLINAVKKGDCIRHVVQGKEQCRLIAAEDVSIPINSEKGSEVRVEPDLPKDIYMPLNEGEKIGQLLVYYGDECVKTCDIVADRSIGSEGKANVKRCFMFYVQTILRNVLR